MASRVGQQKPDPAILRTIVRARRKPRGDQAKRFVVGASLAATLLGWAVFAHEDAQAGTAAGPGTPAVAALTRSTPESNGPPTRPVAITSTRSSR